jgi:two-component system OmpR family response regulator
MRVLVVEDERPLAGGIKRGLEAEGFAVDIAFDGQDGLERANDGDYDAIVLDIMLPGMNGYKVCETLRAAGQWTPVLMLTAKDGDYDQTDAFDLGADDYLTKPFSFIVLVARLRALIRRGSPERPTILQVGDLVLDPARHTAKRSDIDLKLTPREFGLLHYLMRNHGLVVTKKQALEAVWDSHFDGDPNILEVYISYLRKKVDQPFGKNTIQTVWGVGYRLKE